MWKRAILSRVSTASFYLRRSWKRTLHGVKRADWQDCGNGVAISSTRCSFSAAIRPRRRNTVHTRIGHQLPHVLVGMNNDSEVHAIHGGVSVVNLDLALEVGGFYPCVSGFN